MRMEHVSIRGAEDLNRVDPKVARWLRANYTNYGTMNVVHRIWVSWFNYLQDHGGPDVVDKNPDELARIQNELNRKAQVSDDADNSMIFNYLTQCLQENDWSYGYKRKVYGVIKGFFDYSCERSGGFPKLRNGQKGVLKGNAVYEKKEMSEFETILKTVIGASNGCHKAIYSIMAVSGMGPGEIVEFSKSGIAPLMEKLKNPIKVGDHELIEVRLGGRKQNTDKPFCTYIGGSALVWLKQWVSERGEKDTDLNDIFVSQFGTPLDENALSEYWKNVLIRSNLYRIQPGRGRKRTGANLDLIRHLFLTKWEESKAKRSFGDYFLGHFEKLPYNEIHESRDKRIKEYVKALPFTDVWAEKKADEEIEQLKNRVRELEAGRDAEVQSLREAVDKLQTRQIAMSGMTRDELRQIIAEDIKAVLRVGRELEKTQTT